MRGPIGTQTLPSKGRIAESNSFLIDKELHDTQGLNEKSIPKRKINEIIY